MKNEQASILQYTGHVAISTIIPDMSAVNDTKQSDDSDLDMQTINKSQIGASSYIYIGSFRLWTTSILSCLYGPYQHKKVLLNHKRVGKTSSH